MENVIDLFIWGYQQHVQGSLQVSAEELFKQIDTKLKPTVFLLALVGVEHQHQRVAHQQVWQHEVR